MIFRWSLSLDLEKLAIMIQRDSARNKDNSVGASVQITYEVGLERPEVGCHGR